MQSGNQRQIKPTNEKTLAKRDPHARGKRKVTASNALDMRNFRPPPKSGPGQKKGGNQTAST
eukprot:10699754-Lingulodinium_polyedra.AAC.1